MTHIRPRLAAALLLATVIVGCGGAEDDGRDAFRQEANAACDARIKKIQRSYGNTPERQRVAGPKQNAAEVAAFQEQGRVLADLEPPDSLASDYEEMLGYYERSLHLLERYHRRLSTTSDSAARARLGDLLRESNRLDVRGNLIAKEIGLDNCATPVY